MTHFYNHNKLCSDLTDWLNTILLLLLLLFYTLFIFYCLRENNIFWLKYILSQYFDNYFNFVHFQRFTKGCKNIYFKYLIELLTLTHSHEDLHHIRCFMFQTCFLVIYHTVWTVLVSGLSQRYRSFNNLKNWTEYWVIILRGGDHLRGWLDTQFSPLSYWMICFFGWVLKLVSISWWLNLLYSYSALLD